MFSQTVEYALRAMLYLAGFQAAVNGERIAAHTRIPAGYLSKVMRDLVVAQLVRSFRGPNGGFVLARKPSEITILDVVNAVDPIHRVTACPLGHPQHAELCGLHRRIDDALAHIEQSFRSTSLAQVLEGDGNNGRCSAIHNHSQPCQENCREHTHADRYAQDSRPGAPGQHPRP